VNRQSNSITLLERAGSSSKPATGRRYAKRCREHRKYGAEGPRRPEASIRTRSCYFSEIENSLWQTCEPCAGTQRC
jgi:hypothetical protein